MSQGVQIIDPEERFGLEVEGSTFSLRRIDSATMVALERRCRGQEGSLNDEVLDYVLLDWEEVNQPHGRGGGALHAGEQAMPARLGKAQDTRRGPRPEGCGRGPTQLVSASPSGAGVNPSPAPRPPDGEAICTGTANLTCTYYAVK